VVIDMPQLSTHLGGEGAGPPGAVPVQLTVLPEGTCLTGMTVCPWRRAGHTLWYPLVWINTMKDKFDFLGF
jgi:hypothetical protein